MSHTATSKRGRYLPLQLKVSLLARTLAQIQECTRRVLQLGTFKRLLLLSIDLRTWRTDAKLHNKCRHSF